MSYDPRQKYIRYESEVHLPLDFIWQTDIPLVLPILWPYLLKSCGMCNGLGPENKSFVHNYLELKTCIGGVIDVNEQCACIFGPTFYVCTDLLDWKEKEGCLFSYFDYGREPCLI